MFEKKFQCDKVTELDLTCANVIRDEDANVVWHTLCKGLCNLTVLTITGGLLTDQCIPHLSNSLQDQRCQLGKYFVLHHEVDPCTVTIRLYKSNSHNLCGWPVCGNGGYYAHHACFVLKGTGGGGGGGGSTSSCKTKYLPSTG